VSFLAAVAIAAGLSACGNTQVTGAISVQDVQADKLISSTAPGESDIETVITKAHCKGGLATATTVDKHLYSTASMTDVKNFYAELATEGQWFHRQDDAGSSYQTLNYSKQAGDNYWQLHVTLPITADGQYEIQIDAFNPHAHC
jgi:hypothetical protein